MADSSFDIVSKIDPMEARNAVDQAQKEIAQRYDFKGVGAEADWSGTEKLLLKASSEERVKTLKMLWDAVGSEFGGRHELYERNYQGSHEQVRLLVHWDAVGSGKERELEEFAEQAMSEYDLNGWTLPDLR